MRVRNNKLFNLPPSNKNPCKNAIVRSVLIRGETTFRLEPVARFWRLAVSAESRPVRKSQSVSPSDVSPHSSMAKPNLPTVTLGPTGEAVFFFRGRARFFLISETHRLAAPWETCIHVGQMSVSSSQVRVAEQLWNCRGFSC